MAGMTPARTTTLPKQMYSTQLDSSIRRSSVGRPGRRDVDIGALPDHATPGDRDYKPPVDTRPLYSSIADRFDPVLTL